MGEYMEPIKWGILIFPFVAALFTLPYVISQYRKFGSIPLLRVVIVYSFILYLICAYFLVILPLPSQEYVSSLTTPMMQLQPFAFIGDFISNTSLVISNPNTYLKAATEPCFYQVVYNVLLFVPFGVYLRYYFKCSLSKTIILSLLLSLFFELTQLSGLYGFYERSYRLFDVDDLMINTFGGLFGYVIGGLFIRVLPNRDELDSYAYMKGQQVTIWRRLLNYGVDFCLFMFLGTIMALFLPEPASGVAFKFWPLIAFIIYFVVIPTVTKGQTLGKKLLKLRLVTFKEEKPKFYHYFSRYILLYVLFMWLPFWLLYVFFLICNFIPSENFLSIISIVALIAFVIFAVVYYILIFVHLVQGKELWYERLIKVKNISTIKVEDMITEETLENEDIKTEAEVHKNE